MQLADLPIPHLTKLSYEEQLALIRIVRERRRFVAVAKPPKAARVTRKAKDPLAGMSKEQLERLLEVLASGTT